MKTFEMGKQNEVIQPNYKERILKIINDYEVAVRAVSPNQYLDAETHHREVPTGQKEAKDYETVRKDVCESFGVGQDDRHIYIHEKEKKIDPSVKQRLARAFVIVIDALTDEKFYGEGNTNHIEIFNELVDRINGGQDIFAEKTFFEHTPSRYLFFKGFIDNKDFDYLSPDAIKILKTPIFDEEGQEINTPTNWFISDCNLPNQV